MGSPCIVSLSINWIFRIKKVPPCPWKSLILRCMIIKEIWSEKRSRWLLTKVNDTTYVLLFTQNSATTTASSCFSSNCRLSIVILLNLAFCRQIIFRLLIRTSLILWRPTISLITLILWSSTITVKLLMMVLLLLNKKLMITCCYNRRILGFMRSSSL
jgi:hypothetical protein